MNVGHDQDPESLTLIVFSKKKKKSCKVSSMQRVNESQLATE